MDIKYSDIVQCLQKKQRIRASNRRGTIVVDHAKIKNVNSSEIVVTALAYNASLHDIKVIDSEGKAVVDIKINLYGIDRSDFSAKSDNKLLENSCIYNVLYKPLYESINVGNKDKLDQFIKGIDGRNATNCLVAISGTFTESDYCVVLEYVECVPSEMDIGKISPDDKTV